MDVVMLVVEVRACAHAATAGLKVHSFAIGCRTPHNVQMQILCMSDWSDGIYGKPPFIKSHMILLCNFGFH